MLRQPSRHYDEGGGNGFPRQKEVQRMSVDGDPAANVCQQMDEDREQQIRSGPQVQSRVEDRNRQDPEHEEQE